MEDRATDILQHEGINAGTSIFGLSKQIQKECIRWLLIKINLQR